MNSLKVQFILSVFFSSFKVFFSQPCGDAFFQINQAIPIGQITELNTRLGFNSTNSRAYMLVEEDPLENQVNQILVNTGNEENNTPYFIPVCYENLNQAAHNYIMTEVGSLNTGAQNFNPFPAQGGILNVIDNPDDEAGVGGSFQIFDHGMFLYEAIFPNFFYWRVLFQDNAHRRLRKRSYDILTFGFNEPEILPVVSTKGEKRTRTNTQTVRESYTRLTYDQNLASYTASRVVEYYDGNTDITNIWTARDGHLDNRRRLQDQHEYYTGHNISNFIDSNDDQVETKNGSVLISDNHRQFLYLSKNSIHVYSEDDFDADFGVVDVPEIASVEPSNSSNFTANINSDYIPYMNVSKHGRLLIKDADTKETVATIGSDCITPQPNDYHRFLLDNEGDKSMSSVDNYLVWSKYKEEPFKCHFPTIGESTLENGKKLIQFNQIPANNELNYLLSEDGNKISILNQGTIKVIRKEDFNGNFLTSPTIQEFNINI